jgi:ATP/maltotriose-dependent transcriptional regulator MalT
MAANPAQPTVVRREPRIIERPRLIKLLDETDARTILLLAPAGYGKTTLARQWAKTLNGAVWVTLSAAHTDVAWLAEEIAQAVDGKGGTATRAIRQHIRARANPQRASRELGAVLAERLGSVDAQWLILDDYHEITPSSKAEALVATVERDGGARVLVASRVRPRWASGRRFVYGEVLEVGRATLAMTGAEATEVLGTSQSAVDLSEQAAGWPAVIGLAAAADRAEAALPQGTVPGVLHRYLAEELFHRASPELRDGLLALALRGARQDASLDLTLGRRAPALLAEAELLGFNSSETHFELHPLLREFLLEKLLARSDAVDRVREAVENCISDEAWDHALALVLRFDLFDLVEPTLASAFKPLARSGRLATLTAFANAIQERGRSIPPSIRIVLAEAAFRDGSFDLAMDHLETACSDLPSNHPLASRAAAMSGQISFLQAGFSSAEESFRRAGESANDERDAAEAAYGLATASIFGEKKTAAAAVETLRDCHGRSPVDLLRFISSELALRLLGGTASGLSGNLHLDTARQALPQVDDPRVRSNVAYVVASALTQRAEYDSARDWLSEFFATAEEFGLEFAMPYAN